MTKKSQNQEKVDNRKVKCPYCEEMLLRREAIRHTNGRYYHNNCYEEWRGQADDRAQLIDYVCKLYNIKAPTGMMLMQIKRFHDEFNYKYKGMELTLRYFYEVLDNKPRDGDGLGIIPYVYEDATEQYVQSLKIKESASDSSNYESEEITVYINPNKKNIKKGLIDIDSI